MLRIPTHRFGGRHLTFAVYALALALALVACGAEPAATSPVENAPATGNFPPSIGDMAPDFTLPAATGGEVTLSQFRGDRPVVLVFYRAFW